MYLGGGGAKSLVWSQILCDVLGRELLLPEQVETETIGSALLGGMACGLLRREDAAQWNQVRSRLTPDLSLIHICVSVARSGEQPVVTQFPPYLGDHLRPALVKLHNGRKYGGKVFISENHGIGAADTQTGNLFQLKLGGQLLKTAL